MPLTPPVREPGAAGLLLRWTGDDGRERQGMALCRQGGQYRIAPLADAAQAKAADAGFDAGALDLEHPVWRAMSDCAEIGTAPRESVDRALRDLVKLEARRYHEFAHAPREFIPGSSPVPVSGRVWGAEEVQTLCDAALDFWLTTGRFNEAFQQRLGGYLGGSRVLTCNSGSSANLLAVAALTSPRLGARRLVPGDEVITVAAAFPTTVNPLLFYGLVPVFIDVDLATCNAAAGQIEAAVSPRTKAIMLAHTLGNSFDLDEALRVARRHGLWVIEDCCDALGSRYASRRTGTEGLLGSFGDLATFSFYPAHHITMGEGGAVATRDPALFKLVESFRDWGRDCWCPPGADNTCGRRFDWKLGSLPHGYDHKYVYSHAGFNLKLTDMQAAVGLAQMDRVAGFVEARKRNFRFLLQGLADLGQVFHLPQPTPGCDPAWFGFPLTLRKGCGVEREALLKRLNAQGVGTRLLFGGNLLRQPYFEGAPHRVAECAQGLPNTDTVMRSTFWLGLYPGLGEPQLGHVVDCLRRHCL